MIERQSLRMGMGVGGALVVVAFGYIPPSLGALLHDVPGFDVILDALRR